MPNIPHQRKPGKTGGKYGHAANSAVSRARGGSPGAPRKPPGSGCKYAPEPWLFIGIPLVFLTAAGNLLVRWLA